MRLKLIFICTGNLYRSQAAEVMARKIFEGHASTGSAGVSERSTDGRKIPKRLVETLRTMGYHPDEEARAKKVTFAQISDATKVLYMQDSHENALKRMFPKVEKRRFRPLTLYSSKQGLEKIRDLAFIHDDAEFHEVLVEIEDCINGLRKELGV